MIYQLPTGEVIDISIDEYLAVSNESFDRYIRCGRVVGKTNIQLSHEEYNGHQESDVNWDNYLDDNEIEISDNRTLSQIIADMPDDEAE